MAVNINKKIKTNEEVVLNNLYNTNFPVREISVNDDLDDYNEAGNYFYTTTMNNNHPKNVPFSINNSSFRLTVEKDYGISDNGKVAMTTQIFRQMSGYARIYIRTKTGNQDFGEWRSLLENKYSKDEYIVGSYEDKPLYRRMFEYTNAIEKNTQFSIGTLSGIKQVVNIRYTIRTSGTNKYYNEYIKNGTMEPFSIWVDGEDGKVYGISLLETWSAPLLTVIIEYIKS